MIYDIKSIAFSQGFVLGILVMVAVTAIVKYL